MRRAGLADHQQRAPAVGRLLVRFFLPTTLGVTPTFTIGGYVEDEHYSQKNGPSGSRNAQAFYSQLHLAWREMLFVTSGFRLDDAVTYGTHLSPRVSAALIIPGLNTKLRGGYSQGIKAATFAQNVDTAFSRGNPTWRPKSPRAGKSASTSPSLWVSWTRS